MKRISCIGAGAFTDYCLTSYRQSLGDFEVVAVFDQDYKVATNLANKHNISTVCQSIEELLEIEADAVLVLTPPNTHYQIGKQVLNASNNALIEKPLAFSLTQAEELLAIAKQYDKKVTANFVLRTHPLHINLKEIVSANTYGQLQEITTTADLASYPGGHWYWDPAISGGFFLNTYVHFFDIYRFITGCEVTTAGHKATGDSGHRVELNLGTIPATLVTNLKVANENELVETRYIFERAEITTYGWMPERMEIKEGDQVKSVVDELPKDKRYPISLSKIMLGLLDPERDNVVSEADLYQSVRVALLAQENSI